MFKAGSREFGHLGKFAVSGETETEIIAFNIQ
jgi:hypothetical protein